MIGENRMLLILCVKRPSERTHQGGNTGFVMHTGCLPFIFLRIVPVVSTDIRTIRGRSPENRLTGTYVDSVR